MHIEIKTENNISIVVLKGELNIANTGIFKDFCADNLEDDRMDVVLDFSGVEYVDSMGLASLIKVIKGVENRNGKIVISGLSPKVESIFRITKIDKAIQLYPDSDSALRSFNVGE